MSDRRDNFLKADSGLQSRGYRAGDRRWCRRSDPSFGGPPPASGPGRPFRAGMKLGEPAAVALPGCLGVKKCGHGKGVSHGLPQQASENVFIEGIRRTEL